MSTKRRWDEVEGSMSESTLRKRFAAEWYRLYKHTVAGGEQFVAHTEARTMHIVQGSCSVECGAVVFLLVAGDILELDAGKYELKVPTGQSLEYINVYDLRQFPEFAEIYKPEK